MIGSVVCGEAICEEEMGFSVCGDIFWDVEVVVVGFRNDVVMLDGITF